MDDSKPTIVVYIASTEGGKEFKRLVKNRDELSAATKPGIEEQKDGYFEQLGNLKNPKQNAPSNRPHNIRR